MTAGVFARVSKNVAPHGELFRERREVLLQLRFGGSGLGNEMHSQKELFLAAVAELLAVQDIAVLLEQKMADIGDNAAPVGAGQEQYQFRIFHGRSIPRRRLTDRNCVKLG